MALINFTFSVEIGTLTPAQTLGWASKFRGYQETIPDPDNPGETIPNPQTRADFLRDEFAAVAVDWMRTQRRHEVREAAAEAVPDDIRRA